MLKRRLFVMAVCFLDDIITALFLTLASIQTLTAHVFLQTLARFFLMLAPSFFAIPLIVLWHPPWWAIYIIVLNWIAHLIVNYWMQEEEEREKEW